MWSKRKVEEEEVDVEEKVVPALLLAVVVVVLVVTLTRYTMQREYEMENNIISRLFKRQEHFSTARIVQVFFCFHFFRGKYHHVKSSSSAAYVEHKLLLHNSELLHAIQ